MKYTPELLGYWKVKAKQHQGVFGADNISPWNEAMMLVDGFNATSKLTTGWWTALQDRGFDPNNVYLVVAVEGRNRCGGFDSSGMMSDCFNAVVGEFVDAYVKDGADGVIAWATPYLERFASTPIEAGAAA